MGAIEILREKLVGNFYSRFSVGDTFDFYFDGFWLIAHNIVCTDEERLNKLLFSKYEPANAAVDKEDIAKSLVSCCTLRKNIDSVSLSEDCSLGLVFENGVKLQFPTSTEIVDWQWAINEKGNSPYDACFVGCFSPGEIQIDNC